MYRVKHFWHKLFDNSEDYARFLGVKIGVGTTISKGIIWPTEAYLITIGKNVQITNGVRFQTHGGAHAIRHIIPDFDIFGKIVVEDGVYIGAGSQIMPGVTIGSHCIVAAGSIVTKSTPPNSVVGGNPAKVISTTDEFLKKNSQYNLHTKGMSSSKKKDFLLTAPDELFIKK